MERQRPRLWVFHVRHAGPETREVHAAPRTAPHPPQLSTGFLAALCGTPPTRSAQTWVVDTSQAWVSPLWGSEVLISTPGYMHAASRGVTIPNGSRLFSRYHVPVGPHTLPLELTVITESNQREREPSLLSLASCASPAESLSPWLPCPGCGAEPAHGAAGRAVRQRTGRAGHNDFWSRGPSGWYRVCIYLPAKNAQKPFSTMTCLTGHGL